MTDRKYLGWVRDSLGRVVSRPVKEVANTVTTMCGGGHTDPIDGMGNTTPYVLYVYE